MEVLPDVRPSGGRGVRHRADAKGQRPEAQGLHREVHDLSYEHDIMPGMNRLIGGLATVAALGCASSGSGTSSPTSAPAPGGNVTTGSGTIGGSAWRVSN